MDATHKKYLLMLLTMVTLSHVAAQNPKNNKAIVRDMYEAIENNNEPSLIACWVPDMKWYNSSSHFNENEPYLSDNKMLNDIFELISNTYKNLVFSNVQINEIEADLVLATGTIAGLNSKSEKMESIEFKHMWWLKEGKVIKFLQ